MNIINCISRFISSFASKSYAIDDKTIEQHIADEDFPFLVSFPRTGSHWLRIIMEAYFEKPSLVRVFNKAYYNAKSFTSYHTHDMDLTVKRKNVIYLYRDPAPTVYSQMNYDKEDWNDVEAIKFWSVKYAQHLKRWLLEDDDSEIKTILKYENMQSNPHAEFRKVCDHLNADFRPDALEGILAKVTHNKVKNVTKHDPQVINNSDQYVTDRTQFIEKHSDLIMNTVIAVDNRLEAFLR